MPTRREFLRATSAAVATLALHARAAAARAPAGERWRCVLHGPPFSRHEVWTSGARRGTELVLPVLEPGRYHLRVATVEDPPRVLHERTFDLVCAENSHSGGVSDLRARW